MRAIAGFLAGYSGRPSSLPRRPRGWITLARDHLPRTRSRSTLDIELYARWSESQGKARSTIGRRLSTICGFHKICSEERIIERDPSAHARSEAGLRASTPTWTATNSACSLSSGLCGGRDHALAASAGIERVMDLRAAPVRTSTTSTSTEATAPCSSTGRATDRHHPVIAEDGVGVSPLHRPTTIRADLRERLRHESTRPTRVGADRATITKAAGIEQRISPHARGTASSPQHRCWVPLRDVQEAASHSDPRNHDARRPRARIAIDTPPNIVSTFVAGASR